MSVLSKLSEKKKIEGFVPRNPGCRIIYKDQLLPIPESGVYVPEDKEQLDHFEHLIKVNFVERILV